MIYDVNNLGKEIITLGRRGENLAETLRIDVSPWLALWNEASVNIVVLRPHDSEAYIAHTSVTDGILSWPITKTDTANEGFGTFEVRALCGEVVKKSVTVSFKVCPCISCTGDPEPPEGCEDWVNDVLQAADRAEAAAERAEDIAEAMAGGGEGTGGLFLPAVTEEDDGKVLTVENGKWVAGEGGVNFEVDETLALENGILSVNRAEEPEPDNTLPITSAAVYTTVGNINALLETI